MSKHMTSVSKLLVIAWVSVLVATPALADPTSNQAAPAAPTTVPVNPPQSTMPSDLQVLRQSCDAKITRLEDQVGNLISSCSAIGGTMSNCISKAASCSRDMGVAEMDYSGGGETCEDVIPSGCPSAAGRLYDGYKDDESAAREEKNTARTSMEETQDQILQKRIEQMEKQQEVETTISEKRNAQRDLVNDLQDELIKLDREHQNKFNELKAKNAEIDTKQSELRMQLQAGLAQIRDRRNGIIMGCAKEAYDQRDALAARRESMKKQGNGAGRVYRDQSVGGTASSRVIARRRFAQKNAECLHRSKLLFQSLEEDGKRLAENVKQAHDSLENQRKMLADLWSQMSQQLPQDKRRLAERISQLMQRQEEEIQRATRHAQQAATAAESEISTLNQRLQDRQREMSEADIRLQGARALARCTRRFSGQSERLTSAQDAQANYYKALSACQGWDSYQHPSLSCTKPPACREIEGMRSGSRSSGRSTAPAVRVEGN